jgi:SAM-dependent methyltransferase
MDQISNYYKAYYKLHGEASYLGETYDWTSRFKLFGEILHSHFKKAPFNILDVGCGDATFSKLYPEYKWTGIDINTDKTLDKPIKCVDHDITSVPYPLETGSFDAVVCSEVLEHIWDPYTVHLEAHRLLRKDGIYVISTPNFNWLANLLERGQRIVFNPDQPWTMEHIRHYTPESHCRDLTVAGFKILRVYGADHHFCPVAAPILSEVEIYLEKNHNLKLDKGVLHSYVRESLRGNSHTVIVEAQRVSK